ncbi:MAG: hypothetical protein PUD73_00835 [bacterium]|nr:hypothetical protein [bacterium]
MAVKDAEEFIWKNGFTKQNYPKNQVIGRITTNFGSKEELFTYSGSALNYLTQYSNQEHMCGIYTMDRGDESVEYIMGPVLTGKEENVIIPYIASVLASKMYTKELSNMYDGVRVRYLGILHSHPSRKDSNGEYDNNEEFSWGDALVATISGKIWLTTQDGSMYALNRDKADPLILSGLIRDVAVLYSNYLISQGVGWNDYPQWLKVYWPKIQQHDAAANGRNFETVNARAYGTGDLS